MEKDLRAFTESVQQDPLFAAEGLDLTSASRAIEEIEQVLSHLEKAMSVQSWLLRLFFRKFSLARYGVPLPFLRALLESERARRIFIEQQTESTAHALLKSWERAQRILIKSLAHYRLYHVFARAYEPKTARALFEDNFGNQFTFDDALAAISQLVRNARVLGTEIEARTRLLEQGGSLEKTPPIEPIPVCSSPHIPQTMKAAFKINEERIFTDWDALETFGPIGYKLSHFDGVPTCHAFFAYILKHRYTSRREFRTILGDEFFLLDLNQPGGTRHGMPGREGYRPLIERGIPYWYQEATNLYTTRDVEYWADIATLVDLERRPNLDKKSVLAQRSSLFDLLLNTAARNLELLLPIVRARTRNGDKTQSFLNRLLMRTFPSLYYLPFNRSIWRLQETPNFLGVPRGSSKGMLQKLSTMEYQLSPDTLRDVIYSSVIRQEAWDEEERRAQAQPTK